MTIPPPKPMDESTARRTVQQVFSLITAQGSTDYLGERISQLAHSLQAASLAQRSNAPEDTILGALLHDIGRFIPAAEKMESMTAADGTYVGKASHELVGERYLRSLGFSEKICALVGAHVVAKRYLTAVEEGYWEALSESSKTTLRYQGGPFTDAEVAEARKDPLLGDKLAVRRWDDQAKDPNMTTPDLQSFEDMAVRSLLRSTGC
ncbi:unnamed protein product [Zymoseptoria tritici ST99CH_1A5]|uniref:HD domain-containing protein n=1 Tax=Zymoseptoria tritici ST99CH_1A5 TaxID=1276529 RepID=A0A1Y6LMP4_ZYMTR|nr:unnamed protein product [Zymoseptoria tritici ST99CH_3D1]SMY24690.1 unnamed protein product [Zymoseptoria tritici ST99CH_1A5]